MSTPQSQIPRFDDFVTADAEADVARAGQRVQKARAAYQQATAPPRFDDFVKQQSAPAPPPVKAPRFDEFVKPTAPFTQDASVLTDEQKRAAIGLQPSALKTPKVSVGATDELSPEALNTRGVTEEELAAQKVTQPLPAKPLEFQVAGRAAQAPSRGLTGMATQALTDLRAPATGHFEYGAPVKISGQGEAAESYMNTLGPEYVALNRMYKAKTGKDLVYFPQKLTADDDGSITVTPTRDTVDSINAFAAGVKEGGVDEGIRRVREVLAPQASMSARHPGVAERTGEAVRNFVSAHMPGIASIDQPGGIKTDLPRGAINAITLGAVGAPREISPEEKLMNPNAEAEASLARGAGETLGSLVPLIGTETALAHFAPELGAATRTGLTFGMTEAGRQAINSVQGRPVELTAPLESALTGLVMGKLSGENPSIIRKVVAFIAPGVASDVARGASVEDAVKHALTNAGFALTMGGEHGDTETAPHANASRTLGIENAPVSGVQGRGALDADQILAQRESNVRPTTDAQGNVLLNPDEVAQGGKPKIKLANQPDNTPAHHANFETRADDGTFAGPVTYPEEFKPENLDPSAGLRVPGTPPPEGAVTAASPATVEPLAPQVVDSIVAAVTKNYGGPEGLAGDYTPEGMKQIIGLREDASFQRLVNAGVAARNEDGSYRFSDDIQSRFKRVGAPQSVNAASLSEMDTHIAELKKTRDALDEEQSAEFERELERRKQGLAREGEGGRSPEYQAVSGRFATAQEALSRAEAERYYAEPAKRNAFKDNIFSKMAPDIADRAVSGNAEPATPPIPQKLNAESPLLDQAKARDNSTLRAFARKTIPTVARLARESSSWREFDDKIAVLSRTEDARSGETRELGDLMGKYGATEVYEALHSQRVAAAPEPTTPPTERRAPSRIKDTDWLTYTPEEREQIRREVDAEEQSRRYPNVPERPKTIQAQLDARGYALIPEGTTHPLPEGYQAETTHDGVVYFDPARVDAETIRNTPTNELLGHVEPKSAETTRAVVARDQTGNEVHASAVSPENESAQVAETQRNFPDANVESGGSEVAQRVLDERRGFNWETREDNGEWKILNPDGQEVSRVKDRKVAESIVDEMRNRPSEVTGMSLSQAARARGGVNPGEIAGGEWGGLTNKESMTSGLVNRKSGQTEEQMAQALAVDGYGWGDWAHQTENQSGGVGKGVFDIDLNRFREAMLKDAAGDRKSYSVSDINDADPESEYRKYQQSQQDEHDNDATVTLLENEQSGSLYDKIVSGEADEAEVNEFKQHAAALGVSAEATDKLIASAREGGVQEAPDVQSEAGRPAISEQTSGAGNRSEEYLTGARVDVTRAEREARGRDPVQQRAYVAVGDAYASGRRAVESGSVDPRQIAQDVANKPRPLTSTEVGALAYDRARLINGHADAMKELNAALDSKNSTRIEEANLLRGQIEEALDTNDEALERGGREQSAAFNARKMLIREDYSLAKMVNKVKAARSGKDITPELRAQLETLTSDLEKAQKELQRYRADAVNRAARDELAKIFREERFESRKGVRAETRQRLNAEFKGLSSAFGKRVDMTLSANPLFDPELYKLLGQMARNRVLAGTTELSGLVDSLYTEVRQHLPEITKRDIAEAFSGYGIKSGLSKDELATKMRNLKSEQRDLLAMEDIQSGHAPERSGFQRDPSSPESRERQRKIREMLREKGIEIERTVRSPEDQMRTALDSTKTRLRNRIDDLNSLIEGRSTPGKKTSVPLDAEAQALSAERDRLQSAWDQMQEAAKVRPDPDTRRIENALKATDRSIADLERKLKTGDLDPKRREFDPWSTELGKQKQRQADLQGQLVAARKAARPVPSGSELAQRQIDIAERALQKSVDEYTRRINEGDFARKAQSSAAWSAKISDLKGKQAALRNRYDAALKESNAGAAQRVQREMVSVQRNIDEVQGRIDRGEIDPRSSKKTASDWTPELGKLKQRQAEVQAQLDSLRKSAKPALTPEEAALKRYRSYLDRREADLERQITQAELLGRPLEKVKQQYALEPGDLKRQADVKRLKERLDRIVADENWKNRSTPERILGFIPKIRRMILLSSTGTNFKLNSFALQRLVQTPIEEAIGLGYSKLPGLRQVAAQAPRHGGHAFIDGEVAAISKAYGLYVEFVTKGKNSELFKMARGQKSDIESVFGGRNDFPPELTNFFGHIHSAFKQPVKAAEFERAMANRLAFKAKQGADISDPAVIHATALEAYEDANRAILMQDNLPSKMFRGAIRTAEQNGPAGKVVAGALRIVFPITRVSSNFLAEGVGEYGGVNAAARTVQLGWRAIMGKAVSDLSPEQSDAIMRSYKKGSTALGLFGASVAIGFLKPGFVKFGGYYQQGKRKEGDPQFGGVQIGGINVPPVLIHNPLFVPFQIGATMRAVADARQEGGKMSRGDALKEGATAAVKGVASEIPFYEEPARLAAGLEGRGGGVGRYAGEYAGGMVSPPDLQRRARIGDQSQPVSVPGQIAQQFSLKEIHATPRTPSGFTEGFKSKFPGPYGRSSIPENERIESKDRHDALIEGMRNGQVPADDELRSQGYSSAQIGKMKSDAKLTSFQVAFSNARPDQAIERFERMDARQRYQVRDQMAYKAQALITRADYLLDNAKAEDKAKRQAERDKLQQRLDALSIQPEAKPTTTRSVGSSFKPPRAPRVPAMR